MESFCMENSVKKAIYITLGTLLTCFLPTLQAEILEGSYGSIEMPHPEHVASGQDEECGDGKAFKLEVSGDAIGKAKIDHSDGRGHVKYNTFDVDFRFVFHYNKEYQEGLYGILNYQASEINWNKNPFFHKTEFHTASVTLGGFTHRLCNWRWVGEVAINIDTDHPNFTDYAFYDILLWGRYAYSCDVGLHVGLLVRTGMKIDWVYPVLGFDWTINDQWKLNVVFPVNVSLVYKFHKCWSVALAGRAFSERHRVGSHEPLPKALVTYRNAGGELALNYDCDQWLSANAHIGYSFGGTLKIANKEYEHRHHFDFKSAGYVGGELAVRF